MARIIISEKQEKILANLLKEGIYQMPVDKEKNKPYCINPEKVLIVKKFLDKGFSAHDYEKIGNDGLPKRIKVFSMNASNGEPLKYMYQYQLLDFYQLYSQFIKISHSFNKTFVYCFACKFYCFCVGHFGHFL